MSSLEVIKSFSVPLENDQGKAYASEFLCYARFSSSEDAEWYGNQDYGYDALAHSLTASGVLPSGYFVSDLMEEAGVVSFLPVGSVFTDLRGTKRFETPVFVRY